MQAAKEKTSYAVQDEEIKLLFLNLISKDEDKKLKAKIEEFKKSS